MHVRSFKEILIFYFNIILHGFISKVALQFLLEIFSWIMLILKGCNGKEKKRKEKIIWSDYDQCHPIREYWKQIWQFILYISWHWLIIDQLLISFNLTNLTMKRSFQKFNYISGDPILVNSQFLKLCYLNSWVLICLNFSWEPNWFFPNSFEDIYLISLLSL